MRPNVGLILRDAASRLLRMRVLCWREERQRRAVGRLEHHLHLLADLQAVDVAVDDVGLQRRSFLQRDIGDRERASRRFPHQTEGVDRRLARTLLPHRLVGEAERADRAREIMRLAAGGAALDHELALPGRFPERRGLGIGLGRPEFLRISHHTRSRMQVEAAWRLPSKPPVPCATARSQFFTWTFGCASPRSWRTASMILVWPPRLTGWFLHTLPFNTDGGGLCSNHPVNRGGQTKIIEAYL